MEIPYTVTAREDTGLCNSKLAIWLFLASEVMLFGGLFSGYIFLRLDAAGDPLYHWPSQELDWLPGFVNTLVLIGSSVTVVMAWVSLKLRNWQRYQFFMYITLGCAALFMVIKAFEYNKKFHHYSVRLNDHSVLDGHVYQDLILFDQIKEVEIPTKTASLEFLDKWKYKPKKDDHGYGKEKEGHAEKEAGHGGAKEEGEANGGEDKGYQASGKLTFLDESGEPIRHIGRHIRTVQNQPEKERPAAIALGLSQPQKHGVKPSMVTAYDEESMTLRDGTVIKGNLVDDRLELKVDLIDLRSLTVEKVKRPMEDSMVWTYLGDDYKERFMSHANKEIAHFEEEWGDAYDPFETPEAVKKAFRQKFKDKELYKKVYIEREDIDFYATHTPKWNTYYAIYFTMTGLHGLHVIGGALVLAHFLFFGRRIYDKNPEHLCNCVEVGGLFWHFVDLVWIFLFPIMYLL